LLIRVAQFASAAYVVLPVSVTERADPGRRIG